MAQELARFEQEKVANHAKTTHDVYEDVSKVLAKRAKEEERARVAQAREKLALEFEDQLRKKENQFGMQLAQERK